MEVSVSKKPKQVNSRWSLFVPAKPKLPIFTKLSWCV
ncbi:unnamed protein product [Brassica napus]|uniref:(rape) hypothetical protein n=1 Tax=Brassica napus TaxID=3708 RepID=A0A816IWM5_BRANA|nr:unnamed protein product [Brassica napus]